MHLDLGIDAGGSKSAWAILDEAGAVLHEGAGPAIQASAIDPAAVAHRLRSVIHAATEAAGGVHPSSVVAGLAGAGRPTVRAAIRKALAMPFPCAVVGDVEVAAASCLNERPGLAVWAGTGSFAVARDADGRLHRAGGRGWLLDDRGGGYAIVRACAAAVVEAADGVGQKTALTEVLAREFSVPDPLQLGGALQRAWPGEVAAALPGVLAIADGGDVVANRVLRDEARALAGRATAATRRALLAIEEVPIALGGGVLRAGGRFAELLRDALGEVGFAQDPVDGAAAAVGAARLAQAVRAGMRPLATWVEDDRAA